MAKVLKYLVTCGCSWTEGYGTSDYHVSNDGIAKSNNRLSTLLSNHLKIQDINLSEGGGSNQMIFRKIINWINDNEDKVNETLFLIGWTESSRFEFLHPGQISKRPERDWEKIDIMSVMVENKPETWTNEEFKHWEFYFKNLFTQREYVEKTNQYIFSLQNIFENKNIDYLMFNSIGKLKEMTESYFPNQLKIYDKLVDISWEDFCGGHYIDLELNDKDISFYAKNDGHPNDKGNKKWFEYLLKEIK
tara:strand:+ start:451 stop:1191 length:741 start_codon:yes stop_codon:yes gene_type:complete